MQIEFELKVLDVDQSLVREKLKNLGATFVANKDSRRYVYDFNPVNPNSWIRLREMGNDLTLTIKEIAHDGIDGTKELEVVVSDFDSMHAILQKLGYTPRAYQENKRESYELDGVQIEIDSWPNIPVYLEIEGQDEASVNDVLKRLDLGDKIITSENTTKVYARYGINLHDIKDLRF